MPDQAHVHNGNPFLSSFCLSKQGTLWMDQWTNLRKTSLENETLELPIRTWKYIRSRSCLRPLWMNSIFKMGALDPTKSMIKVQGSLVKSLPWLGMFWTHSGWDCLIVFSGFKLPQHLVLIGRIALKVCFRITSPQNQRWKKQCKSSKLNMFSSSLLNRDP